MANNTSQHILNAASTLLGFCLVVITSIHFAEKQQTSIVDEVTTIVAFLLTISSLFSFISIRTQNERREQKLERIADCFFAAGLTGILGIILYLSVYYLNA